MPETLPKQSRGRMALYLLLLAAAIAAMALLRQCSTPSPFEPIEVSNSGADTLDVAIEYGPMTLYRQADTLGAPAYDMLREITSRTGIPVKMHPVASAATGLQMLQAGQVDMLVAYRARTTEDADGIAFTKPVHLDNQVLVQRRSDAPVRSSLQLAGRRVTVTARSPMLQRLRNIADEIGDTIIIDTDDTHGAEQLVMMVSAGDIDLAVVNSRVAAALAAGNPSLDIDTRISFTQFQSWMLRDTDSIRLAQIDSLISDYQQSGAYEALLKRYGL